MENFQLNYIVIKYQVCTSMIFCLLQGYVRYLCVFLHPGKSHSRSNSTPRVLTLKTTLSEFRCTPLTNTGAYSVLSK